MQVHPGAPGTARQGPTRTIMLVNSGGNATQPRAPGHDRPPAAQRAAGHGRLSADSGAPGADVPLAITAGAPGQHRLSAAPIATAPVPAGLRRLRQECLPRVPANPRTLTYPPVHRDTTHNRAAFSHTPSYAQSRESRNPPLSTWWRGAGGEGRHIFPLSSGRPQTTHHVHPAIQVPPRPRSCSTACTGFPCHRCRAPPQPPAENLSLGTTAAGRRADSPSLPGKGPDDRSKPHHTWHYPCGFGLSGG